MQTTNRIFALTFARMFIAFFVLLSMSAGCGAGEIPKEHQSFFSLPATQQHKELAKYPLERQVDIYVFAVTWFRPSAYGLGFSDDIAKHGQAVVPILLDRFKTAPKDSHKQAILHVFRDMVKFHHDFRDDKDTMDVLKQVVGSMKGSFSEEESERLLKEILTEPKKERARVP